MGTTSNGLPYPEGTDKVYNGDDAIHELAEALPVAKTGVTSTATSIPATSTVDVLITYAPAFPGGRVVSLGMVAGSRGSITITSPTAPIGSNSQTYTLRNYGASSATAVIAWIALAINGPYGLAAERVAAPAADTLATCSTPGCPSAGVGVPVTTHYDDEDGNPVTVAGVYCGECGEPADLTASS